jgi:hypothetical protein
MSPHTDQGDLGKLPAALQPLTNERRWLIWKWEKVTNEKGDTKWTKVPYRPAQPTVKGSSTKPATWNTYEAALRAYDNEHADGIGYCLYGDSIGAFDIDDCRDPSSGDITKEAQKLVARAGSYTEITVSGTGLRIIGYAKGKKIHRKQQIDDFKVETYRDAERFIVTTGKQLPNTPDKLANLDVVMDAVVTELDAAKAAKAQTKPKTANRTGSGTEDKLQRIIKRGENGEYGGDKSRAEFYVITEMLRRGYGPEAIRKTLLNRKNGISAKAHGETDPREYVVRQIERGMAKVDFACDKDGSPYHSPDNIRVALVKFGITLRHDMFALRDLIEGLPGFGPALDDPATTRIYMMMDQQFHFLPAKGLLQDVLADTARLNEFHPVQDYLRGLRWDGTERLDTWLTDYGGAPENDYTRAVGKLMLIAAVRRVYEPGCKFDEMVVFEGPQGSERSTALSTLAVDPDWFSDDLPLNADSAKVIERIKGRWIVEAAELSGMRRGDIEHIKAFLSRRIDRARPAYGHFLLEAPRQCIIVGTTNDDNYLRDLTGNRRFWPVLTPKWRLKDLKDDRDQLWAEAREREADGASIRLPRKLWPDASREQTKRTIADPYVEQLAKYLNTRTTWDRDGHEVVEPLYGRIRSTDAWDIIGLPVGQRTQSHNERLGNAMRALGWRRLKQRFGSGSEPEWAYVRDEPGEEASERRTVRVRRSKEHVEVDYEGDD